MLSKLMPPVDENQLQQQQKLYLRVWRYLAFLLTADTT